MTYGELSTRLEAVAANLHKHERTLEGQALSKATTTFAKALGSYEKKLADFLQGTAPGAREFEDLIKSPQAKKHLTLPALKVAFRQILGQALHEETAAKAKASLVKQVRAEGDFESAVVYLKEFFFRAASPLKVGEDKESLQAEFLRLGGLPDDELEFQLQHRFKTVGALKKLAKANAVNFTATTSKPKLIETIVHYARRAHQNVGT